jgi:hypothetical protein
MSSRGGGGPLGIEIGEWSYRFEGLDEKLREALLARYGVFVTEPEGEDRFHVRVLDGREEHFVSPESESTGGGRHPLSLGWEGEMLLVRSYGFAGWLSFADQKGEIALSKGEFEKGPWSVENFLRVCTAWRAAFEGGALLHAACLIRGQGAYIFMGASGSGKSTLASRSTQERVLSDDLTLVRKGPQGFRVEGTPFRGTYQGGEPVKGRFPIAGIYRIFKADRNSIEPCPRRNAVADLLAACPFVVDQLDRYPEILSHLRTLDLTHPLAYLHFTLQGDFWNILPRA